MSEGGSADYCPTCSAAPSLRTRKRFNKKPYIVKVNMKDHGQRTMHCKGKKHIRNLFFKRNN